MVCVSCSAAAPSLIIWRATRRMSSADSTRASTSRALRIELLIALMPPRCRSMMSVWETTPARRPLASTTIT